MNWGISNAVEVFSNYFHIFSTRNRDFLKE